MEPLVLQFQGFVTDLTTVEKRSIVALTEIARDALRTHPHVAPTLANIIIDRIIQAPANVKLPALYLLDSVAKNVGEPYKTYFAARLPELFGTAWAQGAPGLHPALTKLLDTWANVFPPQVYAATQASKSAAAAPSYAAPLHANGYGAYPQPTHYAGGHKPMTLDPRLGEAPPLYPSYGGQPAYGVPPPVQPAAYAAAPMYPAPAAPSAYEQRATMHPVHLPDLLSLISATSALQPAAGGGAGPSPQRTAAAAPVAGGKPATVEFSTERIKENNPAAMARLLAVTQHTKSSFLDRKFLRKKQQSSNLRAVRLWYVDVDTWLAGTATSAEQPGSQAGAAKSGKRGADVQLAEPPSVPADDEQTHCALSGEPFEQFWDEGHQEWRYRDAVKLTAEEAASYGLEEGALVLVSAMNGGAPAAPTTLGGVANEDAKEAQKKEESDAQGVKRSVSPEEEVGRGKRVKRES